MTVVLSDATIQDLVIGVVGNGLYSLVAQSGAKVFHQLRTLIASPPSAVIAAIREASDRLKDSIAFDDTAQQRLLNYVKSPEVEVIVRQLFATSLVGSEKTATVVDVKREFISSMSKHMDIDESRIEPFAMSFLKALVKSIDGTLNLAIEKGVLSAHEAKSAFRHRMLVDEISNLRKNLKFLLSNSALDLTVILEFENRYRELVGFVHAHIKPPHLESGRRVPIEEIFVSPRISWIIRVQISCLSNFRTLKT